MCRSEYSIRPVLVMLLSTRCTNRRPAIIDDPPDYSNSGMKRVMAAAR
jgi:hypothetical protein